MIQLSHQDTPTTHQWIFKEGSRGLQTVLRFLKSQQLQLSKQQKIRLESLESVFKTLQLIVNEKRDPSGYF